VVVSASAMLHGAENFQCNISFVRREATLKWLARYCSYGLTLPSRDELIYSSKIINVQFVVYLYQLQSSVMLHALDLTIFFCL